MAKIFVTTEQDGRYKINEAEHRYIQEQKPGQFKNHAELKAFLSRRPGAVSPSLLGFCTPAPAPAS